MKRMRSIIDRDVNMIRDAISKSKNIDYYTAQAEFTAPYTIKVGKETITSKMILYRPMFPSWLTNYKLFYNFREIVIRIGGFDDL